MKDHMKIAGRKIGPGSPMYIIAEMSANHGQDLRAALEIIREAKRAGADAVKLQTYTPDTLTIDCDNKHFRIKGTLWNKRTLYDLYGEACTPWDWHPRLKKEADKVGIALFSTPYDATSVDFLKRLNMPAYKVASFENVDIPLLKKIAATRRPVILSTGMADLSEIDEAVRTLRAGGVKELALLKCTSVYPARPEEMNLRGIGHLAGRYKLPIGLSDHTLGIAVATAAAALGASLLEKHLTLSRKNPGPDSAFSLEPHEFKAMVDSVREAERALGRPHFGTLPREKPSLIFRRSLFVVENVKAGETFTSRNVRSIRPGFGLHTRHLEEVLGRKAARNIARGTPLSRKMIAPPRRRAGARPSRKMVK